MTDYTEKIKEFDEKFTYWVALGSTLKDGSVRRFNFGENKDPREIRDFISTSIQEAVAEERERMRDKIANIRGYHLMTRSSTKEHVLNELHDLLFLDKPLTDKESE